MSSIIFSLAMLFYFIIPMVIFLLIMKKILNANKNSKKIQYETKSAIRKAQCKKMAAYENPISEDVEINDEEHEKVCNHNHVLCETAAILSDTFALHNDEYIAFAAKHGRELQLQKSYGKSYYDTAIDKLKEIVFKDFPSESNEFYDILKYAETGQIRYGNLKLTDRSHQNDRIIYKILARENPFVEPSLTYIKERVIKINPEDDQKYPNENKYIAAILTLYNMIKIEKNDKRNLLEELNTVEDLFLMTIAMANDN